MASCGLVVFIAICYLAYHVRSDVPSDTFIKGCPKMLADTNQYVASAKRSLCNGKCNCSCDDTCRRRNANFRSCCEAQGLSETCNNLCRFDTSIFELSCQMEECPFEKFTYCAADSNVDYMYKRCCRATGMPTECLRLCSNQPTTKPHAMDNLGHCMIYTKHILQCLYDNPPMESRWQQERDAGIVRQFDEEVLSAEQLETARAARTPACNGLRYQ